MKLVFDFPRKGVTPKLKDINEFLSNTDLASGKVRKFGVYRRMIGVREKKSEKQYLLQFKFFENVEEENKKSKEIKDFRIEINQGYFNTNEANKKQALEKLERDVCILSYIASLDLESVEFSVNEDLLSVKVELNDLYQIAINRYKELILPVTTKN